MCCSVLQGVAEYCSVLQCVDGRVRNFKVFTQTDIKSQHTSTYFNTLQHTTTHCNMYLAGLSSGRHQVPTHCNTLQQTTTHCNVYLACFYSGRYQVPTHCNTLQHTALCIWQVFTQADTKSLSKVTAPLPLGATLLTDAPAFRRSATGIVAQKGNAPPIPPQQFGGWV